MVKKTKHKTVGQENSSYDFNKSNDHIHTAVVQCTTTLFALYQHQAHIGCRFQFHSFMGLTVQIHEVYIFTC